MSPGLAGRLCTGSPGKSRLSFLNDASYVFSFDLNVFLQSTLKLNICLRVVQIPSRGVSKVLHPGWSELLSSFVKLKLLLLLSLLIGSLSQGIQRDELPTFSETFVKCLLILDCVWRGQSLWREKGFRDPQSKQPPGKPGAVITRLRQLVERQKWKGAL